MSPRAPREANVPADGIVTARHGLESRISFAVLACRSLVPSRQHAADRDAVHTELRCDCALGHTPSGLPPAAARGAGIACAAPSLQSRLRGTLWKPRAQIIDAQASAT